MPVTYSIAAPPTALDQGRYTWRHDSILRTIVRDLKRAAVLPDWELYADLDLWRAEVNTIPPAIISTPSRPDIVLVKQTQRPN